MNFKFPEPTLSRTLLSRSILDLFIYYGMSLKKETDAEKVSSREKNHEFFDIKF